MLLQDGTQETHDKGEVVWTIVGYMRRRNPTSLQGNIAANLHDGALQEDQAPCTCAPKAIICVSLLELLKMQKHPVMPGRVIQSLLVY